VLANHQLGARARRHAFGFDADRTPHAVLVGVRDTDELVGLFAAFAAYGRPALETEIRAQANVGAECLLRIDDLARDLRHDVFDPSRLLASRENVERRFLEQFGEARHVDARFVGREIGDHRKFAIEDRLATADIEADHALHARDADAIDRQLHVGLVFLTIRQEI